MDTGLGKVPSPVTFAPSRGLSYWSDAMFADPQSVTINSVAQSLPRLGTPAGVFQKDDGSYKLSIAHNLGARNRRVIRLDNYKTATDPLTPTNNAPYRYGVWLAVDAPKVGYTAAEQLLITNGFLAFLSASSYAAMTKFIGGES